MRFLEFMNLFWYKMIQVCIDIFLVTYLVSSFQSLSRHYVPQDPKKQILSHCLCKKKHREFPQGFSVNTTFFQSVSFHQILEKKPPGWSDSEVLRQGEIPDTNRYPRVQSKSAWEEAPGCLRYIRDEFLPSYSRHYFINHH